MLERRKYQFRNRPPETDRPSWMSEKRVLSFLGTLRGAFAVFAASYHFTVSAIPLTTLKALSWQSQKKTLRPIGPPAVLTNSVGVPQKPPSFPRKGGHEQRGTCHQKAAWKTHREIPKQQRGLDALQGKKQAINKIRNYWNQPFQIRMFASGLVSLIPRPCWIARRIRKRESLPV